MKTIRILKAGIVSIFMLFTLFSTAFTQDTELETLYVAGRAVLLENDFVAQDIRDANGQICGMIIVGSDLTGLTFNAGNGIVRVTEDQPGQYKVFLQPGERILEIYKLGYGPLRIILYEYGLRSLESGKVWELGVTGSQEQSFGDLILETNPSGADITIEGMPDFFEQTPYEFTQYVARSYLFHLSMRSYAPVDTLLTVEPDIEKTLVIDLASLDTEQTQDDFVARGQLSIVSNLSDAIFAVRNSETDRIVYKARGNPNRRVPVGTYIVEAIASGYTGITDAVTIDEDTTEPLTISFEEQHKLSFIAANELGSKVVWRSAFLPGMGQLTGKRYIRGGMYLTGELAALGVALLKTLEYTDLDNDYNTTLSQYNNTADPNEMTRLASEAQKTLDEVNSTRNLRDTAIVAAVGFYALNVLDAWLIRNNIIKNYEQINVSAMLYEKGLAVSVKF
ncbi:DUF5683 domain-containing protein [Candidatus Latescibacterota bacterium]